MAKEEKKMLTATEFANELNIHPATVRRWLADGTVKGIQVGKKRLWRIERSELYRIKKEGEKK